MHTDSIPICIRYQVAGSASTSCESASTSFQSANTSCQLTHRHSCVFDSLDWIPVREYGFPNLPALRVFVCLFLLQ